MTYALNKRDGSSVIGDSEWILTKLSVEVNGELTEFPLIGLDSSQTEVFDYGGAVERIVIEGHKVDTVANITTFLTTIRGLVSGDQGTSDFPYTFTATYLGAPLVKFRKVHADIVGGEPTIALFMIEMVRSASV